MIQHEYKFLHSLILVEHRTILTRKLSFHRSDASEWIGFISQHKIEECHRLIEKLVILKPGLIEVPFLPSVIPWCK